MLSFTELQNRQDSLRSLGISSTHEQLQASHAQLLLAAEALQEQYSLMDFHAERAAKNPRYWLDWADGCQNLLPKRCMGKAPL